MEKISLPPEQRMNRAERAAYDAARRRAKTKKQPMPPVPEPFKKARPDVMALLERIEAHELRGLIDIKHIVHGKLHYYRCIMLVQRNGLASVRQRESEKFT